MRLHSFASAVIGMGLARTASIARLQGLRPVCRLTHGPSVRSATLLGIVRGGVNGLRLSTILVKRLPILAPAKEADVYAVGPGSIFGIAADHSVVWPLAGARFRYRRRGDLSADFYPWGDVVAVAADPG